MTIDPLDMPVDCAKAHRLCPTLSVSLIRSIKLAGTVLPDSAFSGRYTTVRKLCAWLERHPEFRTKRHSPR